MIALLWILNLADAVSTWFLTRVPGVIEINPLMRALLSHGPWPFFGVKVGLVSLACLAASSVRGTRQRGTMRAILIGLMAVYAVIALVHAQTWWLVYTYGGR